MRPIDQYQLNRIFDSFQRALRYDPRVKGMKANSFMLIKIQRDGVVTFKGLNNLNCIVEFNALHGKIVTLKRLG